MNVESTCKARNPLFDEAFETLPLDRVRRHQDALWATQWDYIRSMSVFYRAKLARWIDREMTLDSLQDLPFTEKDELRISQDALSPFGDYVACGEARISRLHRTSGTTGRPLILANSAADAHRIARVGARSMWAAGLRPTDRVVHCLNYCMWTGGFTDHTVLEATGATVVPFGVGNTRQLIDSIINLRINAISCTPSYPGLIEQVLRESAELRPRDLKLTLGLFGGEAGLDNPDLRNAMEEKWGFKVRNANFGLSEVLSILGGQTDWTHDLLYHASDVVFAEIVDPATLQRLPIAEGTMGELVCTHLQKECQPLVRYRTRDVVTVTGVDRGPDGRTAWRFRVTGRTDDMFNVRGINVFPSAVRVAVESIPQWASGVFRIRLKGEGPYDRITMAVEAAQGLPAASWSQAKERVEAAIRTNVGATADVTMVPFEHFPRTEGKTRWVEKEV
ncbi:phenylacetate--CoA ligase family protein [Burkholderia pseudomultivorans]|uniref:Phenylacetate--CoA ligase n=1 Tax=Burkholderia pseudomultivorans TaxID=1207504 RepID=A0A132EH95_9BURK|nr:AMP-binding protein [Burkholderia pseudomultivorans]KWF30199.1 phenylacetate--CoA ligase [Burkholderia pseudomultivorans]MDR8727126.1 Phenylacetate-coenzyme A ligase [Burkholderia pseudomultivorans]MDR8733034.1 Phenylacetate-coenzyme A ligase [Burkholderia pseudomultivorans]MDR8739901.1 Phenylacetate-coenzyme A ligase [Burkholderia pseudomultivorans]MDR8756017.1 Phenylacetate-coenzyme A ligase [Burkholderia pseudomultivorans]